MGRTAYTEPQCLYKGAPFPSPPFSAVVKKEYSYTSTPLWAVRPVQSLSACTTVHFTFLSCDALYLMNITVGHSSCSVRAEGYVWVFCDDRTCRRNVCIRHEPKDQIVTSAHHGMSLYAVHARSH